MRKLPTIISVVMILLVIVSAGCGKKEEKLQVTRGLAARIGIMFVFTVIFTPAFRGSKVEPVTYIAHFAGPVPGAHG